MTEEIWRDVPSLPVYAVSSFGRIMCKPFRAVTANGAVRTYGGKPWLGCWAKDQNRYIFRFRGKTYKVAPLICEAFNGPCPEGHGCMHLDENSKNNRPENLAWGTQFENLNAPGFRAHCSHALRGKRGRIISDEAVREIRSRSSECQAALAREFGVSACHINNLIARRARPNA